MTEESKARTLIEEARGLLGRLKEWPANGVDIKHALFADAVERERDSPFFGCSTPVADLYARAPDLLSQLCDELDQQVSQNETQAENIRHLQDLCRAQKAAIESAILFLQDCGYMTNKQVQEKLIASITPKGEQS